MRHRFVRILRGDEAETAAEARGLLEGYADVLWVGRGAAEPSELRRWLGTSLQAVVLDGHHPLPAEVFGQAQGVVLGGGGLLLGLPPRGVWPPDPRLAIPPFSTTEVGDRFARRVVEALRRVAGEGPLPPPPQPPAALGTPDQARVVAALRELLDGPPQCAVVTARRGRGKSSALGLALRGTCLATRITAPHRRAIQEILRFSERGDLAHTPPEEVVAGEPYPLIVVDEAAGLSVGWLQQLVRRFPSAHLWFATTTEGYEGTGRGFGIRFGEWLRSQPRPVHRFELETPIRWAADDPLEGAVSDALLLAPPPPAPPPSGVRDLHHQVWDRDRLAADEAALASIFALLVHAHYRTTPGDLHRLLDAPNLTLHTLSRAEHVVAASIVALEGPLDPDTIEALRDGRLRLQGRALPETLVCHAGAPAAGALRFARSVRIVTHPDLRRQGLARALVDAVHAHHDVDAFGTLFGATAPVVRFRQALGYSLVRLGSARGARTGDPAAVMVRPVSPAAREVVADLRRRLAARVDAQIELLDRDAGGVAEDLVDALRRGLPGATEALPPSEVSDGVRGYAFGPRPLESVVVELRQFCDAHAAVLARRPAEERSRIEARVLRGEPWWALARARGTSVPTEMRATRRAFAALARAASDASGDARAASPGRHTALGLRPMAAPGGPLVPNPIVTEEIELLDQIRTWLNEEPYEAPVSEKEIVEELVRLRDEIPNAKEEDQGALREQFDRQYALLTQVRESRDRPVLDPDSPYFAHLRLTEGGRSRDVFLGKTTRVSGRLRIVDWRDAPISRLFYAYQQGEEYEEEFGGRVHEGEVAARRTLTIQRGELQRVDAPEGSFSSDPEADDGWRRIRNEPARLAGGQGAALRAHAVDQGTGRRLGTDTSGARKRRDKRLPDIAGLIDAEQFELITQPSSGFVVIRGTAGSGKTTVALHRIAYLAYRDPEVNSPRTLFIVFSSALRQYVSHVLPALGVPRAEVRDFRSWARTQVRRHFPKLPRSLRSDTPAAVVRLKLHPVVLSRLADQVRTVAGPASAEQAFDDLVSVLTDVEGLRRSLSEEARESGVADFRDAELVKATTWCRDRFEEIAAWQDGDKEADAALDPEDEVLLLRAWQLRVGPLRHRRGVLRYRHIAIDEVQDFSPVEVRVLIDCLDRHRSITLAGDTQQHVMQDAGFTSWTEFFDRLGIEGTAVNTLRVAYRSSRPIVAFSQAVLGDLREDDDPPLTTRDGPEVELFRFTDEGACVAFLADSLKELVRAEPLASVALLSPSPEISGLYFAGLSRSEVPRLRRVTRQDFTFAPGIEIAEVATVKGLEFDYVVVLEASARYYPDAAEARRLLHVASTRAIHQLWLTSVGTPSPVLREIFEGGAR